MKIYFTKISRNHKGNIAFNQRLAQKNYLWFYDRLRQAESFYRLPIARPFFVNEVYAIIKPSIIFVAC